LVFIATGTSSGTIAHLPQVPMIVMSIVLDAVG
jgi:hypothetical protein